MRIGSILGASKQTEILIFSIFGIICTIFDASLLDFNSNLYKIWDVRMDPSKFSERIELYIKYLLSGIVLVRTFTVHIYLGCYIIMLYPTLFEDRPVLMIPWMIVNCIKCIFTGFLSLSAGVYTCILYRFMQPTCWEFIITQIIDNAPSLYLFILVLSYYRDMRKKKRFAVYVGPADQNKSRRPCRFMERSSISVFESSRRLISVSTVENVFEDHLVHIINSGMSRSLDTLLTQLKETEEDEISIYGDMDDNLSIEDRTARFLQLTHKDIEAARRQQTKRKLECKKEFKSMSSIPNVKIPSPLICMSDNARENSEMEIMTVMPLNPSQSINSSTSPDDIKEFVLKTAANGSGSVKKIYFPNKDKSLQSCSWDVNTNTDYKKLRFQRNTRKRNTQIRPENNPIENAMPPITEFYVNKASYVSSYKDDGYTQAFYESFNNIAREE